MSDADVIPLRPPDHDARRRIASDLDANLLVEAGAGSGKTTALVERMLSLVETGTARVDEIAAVTFTRKAAGELRERFQDRLETRLRMVRADGADPPSAHLLSSALDDVDRAFIGTIHSFCARILREHPLEVGLDPAFQELAPEARLGLRSRFWEAYLERQAQEGDPRLEALADAGLRPTQLYGLFDRVVENPDVEFPAKDEAPPPESGIADTRRELEEIVERGMELMPTQEPSRGWDSLQRKIRTLAFTRAVTGWDDPADFFEALDTLCKPGPQGHRPTQYKWRDKGLARAFGERVNAFAVGDTPARALLDQWLAHRYALALDLVRHAAAEFQEHRRRAGLLDFQDLLLLAARLLRDRPDVRGALGLRYRRLLVDEFQDTDPLQAEVMLLLSSEPGESDWTRATPRPGALFVVGDPKQSIYRFRRADIRLYEVVKARFGEFGDVLELTANFRSVPDIGDLVAGVFDAPDFFPRVETPEQARFEPLNTRPPAAPPVAQGVFWYAVDPGGTGGAAVTEDDAERLASWIRRRIDQGAREPRDFMILTRRKGYLATYARALEARSIPVQVTGAGVGMEQELHELLTVLECMIDPTDPVKVVAALVGLFFGLDFERLVAHRLSGGGLDAMRPGTHGDAEVLDGLRTLHRWWRVASREPADIFVHRLVAERGLLPYAAAGELGSLRAGALGYALDAVRAAALAGDTSLPGVLDALRAAMDLREAEAPLEPGRPDVVRLMNLHQAKGLEARVVILADPSRKREPRPDFHVQRSDDGTARGYLSVIEVTPGRGRNRVLARPGGWERKEDRERRFREAEDARLLYVAVTRAAEELVVARWPRHAQSSDWRRLDPWLLEHAVELDMEIRAPGPRQALEMSPGEAARRVERARGRLEASGHPSYRFATVTGMAKSGYAALPEDPRSADEPSPNGGFRGYSWGSAVHGALALAASGSGGEALRAACRALLVENERPLDENGEPRELDDLVSVVESVTASDLWSRATLASHMLAEVPFAVPELPPASRSRGPAAVGAMEPAGAERRQLDLFGMEAAAPPDHAEAPAPEEEAPATIVEGVIDLAFREPDGWVIVDYKTDVGTDPAFPRRVQAYRRQVDLYAHSWEALTGDPVKERVLFFTSQRRLEAW